MSRKKENTGFECEHCGRQIVPATNGSYRNHCPFCLRSKHVDRLPGDRQSECRGLMAPEGLRRKSGKGWQIVFRCLRCGTVRVNKISENTEQPDDMRTLVKLSRNNRFANFETSGNAERFRCPHWGKNPYRRKRKR